MTAGERGGMARVLSIAGSDSGGGAGIQADLKAFARCGVYGMSAITAITAQSTVGVSAVHPVPPEIVLAQVREVAGDIGVDAVKVGMLGTREVTLAVAEALDELEEGTPVVVDTVMVSESGAQLLQEDALEALVREIVPRATVITPNLPEARQLARLASEGGGKRPDGGGRSGGSDEELVRLLITLGPGAVVLTGGHREKAADLLIQGEGGRVVEIEGARYAGTAAHGSGCTHSSVLAAHLALGLGLEEAARAARRIAGEAVRDGLAEIGTGAGPVDVLGLARRDR